MRLRVEEPEGDGEEEEEDASEWREKEGKIWDSLEAFEAYVRFVDDILLLFVCWVSLESDLKATRIQIRRPVNATRTRDRRAAYFT